MRPRFRAIVLAIPAACAACSLIVDTDGLSSPQVAMPDGGRDAVAPPKIEAGAMDAGPKLFDEGGATDLYVQAVRRDNPTAYWRLAEDPSAVKAKDEMGKRDGTYVSVTLGEDGPGPGHRSARFDGMKSRVQSSGRFEESGMASLSVEAWIAPAANTQRGCHHFFTAQQRTDPKHGIAMLEYWDTAPSASPTGLIMERWAANEGRNSRQGNAFFVDEEKFTYVVGVYDGKKSALFVNGLLQQTGSADFRGIGAVDVDTVIGADEPASYCPWNGRIADVAVYERALTPEIIAAHYAAMPR